MSDVSESLENSSILSEVDESDQDCELTRLKHDIQFKSWQLNYGGLEDLRHFKKKTIK